MRSWHVNRTSSFPDQRPTDGFTVELTLLEVGTGAAAPLDEPEPNLVIRRKRIELLQHLLGREMLHVLRLGSADYFGVAHAFSALLPLYAGLVCEFGRLGEKILESELSGRLGIRV
jgi:hypothetical protein